MLGVKVQGSGGSGDWYLALAVPVGRTTATICPLAGVCWNGSARDLAWVGVVGEVVPERGGRHPTL